MSPYRTLSTSLCLFFLLFTQATLISARNQEDRVAFQKEGPYIKAEAAPFVVYSSLKKSETRKLIRAAITLHEAIPSIYGHTPEFHQSPTLYLLSHRAEFFAFVKDQGGSKYAGGYFTAHNNRIVLYWNRDRESTTAILLHELGHLYSSAIFKTMPQALNEGISEYIEATDYRFNRIKFGYINESNLKLFLDHARGNKLHPLPKLMNIRGYGLGSIHENFGEKEYAQSWALIWYCQNGPEAIRKRFRKYCRWLHTHDDYNGKEFLLQVVQNEIAFTSGWIKTMSEGNLDSRFNRHDKMTL